MLDHVGLEVSDFGRSKAFYEAALEPLGIALLMEFEGAARLRQRGDRTEALLLDLGRGRPRSAAPTSHSARRAERSTPSTPPRSPPAAPTTAPRALARSTTPATTAPSSSTPTATTSRPSTTPPAAAASRPGLSAAAGTRLRGRPAVAPSAVSSEVTSPVTITWSPPAITSRRSQATKASAPSIAGTPSCSLHPTPSHFSATGALVAKARARSSCPSCRTLTPKRFGGLHGEQGARAAVEAGQHQHRLDRERGDRVGGRPRGAVRPGGGDHRDAGGQHSHRGAEAGGIGCAIGTRHLFQTI